MKLPKLSFPESPTVSQSKSFWNSVLTATPVVLTVFATVLAGLSTSEMTLAQYHRSMAAQDQSKASDQWNLFQAKRIRGTEVERTIRLLQALSEPANVDEHAFEVLSAQLSGALKKTSQSVEQLQEATAAAKEALGSTVVPLRQATKGLQVALQKAQAQATEIEHKMADARQSGVIPKATPPMPTSTSIQDHALSKAVDAIRSHRPDAEVTSLVGMVRDQDLMEALSRTNATIAAVEQTGKSTDAAGTAQRLLRELLGVSRSLGRPIEELEQAGDLIPVSDAKGLATVRHSLAAVTHSGADLRALVIQWRQGIVVAEDEATLRRYNQEARVNEIAAELYEVRVRKSDLKSERHRDRSKLFFYGMLAAQAGVMIASFSLAVKHRSVLWSLATLAGLGAVLYGTYVYLYT
jgi:hypothetical protein